MPKIPVYDNFQVGESGLPAARVNVGMTPELASQGGRQMVETGRAVREGALTVADYYTRQIEEANILRVDDANNRRNEIKLKMLYDKDFGLTNVKGLDALERASGKPLADEYRDKYKEEIQKIAETLGNDAQKQRFMLDSEQDLSAFYGTAIKHEGDEFKNYALSVRKGTISNRINEIGLRYNDPEAVNLAVESIKASAYEEARLLGKSAAEAEAYTRGLTSKAHTTAIMSALEKNDARFADMYMKKNAKDMEADDILRVNGVLTKELDAQIASETVNAVLQEQAPNLQTTDLDRAFNVALQKESNGRQFDKNGKPLTSSAGAIGIAQVMPNMGPAGAKLAGLEWDENKFYNDAKYNAAVGKALFEDGLRRHGGNLALAYADYNLGGPKLSRAMAAAKAAGEPENWLKYTPAETRDYVTENMKNYGTGGGINKRPSLYEMQTAVRDRLGTERPERLKMALDAVESEYKRMDAAIKQQGEEAKADAMRALLANGGRYADLPAPIKAAVPVEEVGSVMDFAKKLATGDDAATDWALYYKLKNDPALLQGSNLIAFRDKLSDTEFKELTKDQADIRSGKGMTKLRPTKDILDGYLSEIGIDPESKDVATQAKIGKIWNALETRVRDREAALGRALTPDELGKEAAKIFANKVTKRGFLGGSDVPYALLEETDKLEIPRERQTQIIDALKRKGVPITDDNVQRIYREWLKDQQK